MSSECTCTVQHEDARTPPAWHPENYCCNPFIESCALCKAAPRLLAAAKAARGWLPQTSAAEIEPKWVPAVYFPPVPEPARLRRQAELVEQRDAAIEEFMAAIEEASK